MSYIGKTPTIGNFQICDAISVVNNQAAYTMQVGSVNVSPESANHMIVSLNGVIQKPTDAFTVSASVITFASNLVTGDVIDFIQILGNVLDLGVPSDATVSTAKIVDGAVTSAKITYPLTTFSSTGIDDNANALAMTITAEEKVGIGETSPLANLHVKNADSGITPPAFAETVFVEDSGNSGITIGCGTSNVGSIVFGDSGDNDIGKFQYNHSDNSMSFTVNAAERMRITSAGHITAPNLNTTGSTGNRYPLYWVHSGTTGSMEPYTGSIRAMKTDINNMSSVNWIHSLTPRSFKFRDYETDENGNRTYLETTNDLPNTEYGLIAEEVNEVSGSDYILDKQTDEDGNENVKGVLYHNLVPVLLKAVQEQKTKIEELEARITTLENA